MLRPKRASGDVNGLEHRFRMGLIAAALAGALVMPGGPPAIAQTQVQPSGENELEKTQHGDWTVRCGVPQGASERFCDMMQDVVNQDNGKKLLEVVVSPARGESPNVAIFVTPTGVLLPAGVTVRIDQGEPVTIEYRQCVQSACIAPMELTEARLQAMKAGQQVHVRIVAPNGKTAEIPISLSGFTAAFSSLKS